MPFYAAGPFQKDNYIVPNRVKTNLTVEHWKQANERMTPTKRHNATVITRQLPLECNVLTRDFNSSVLINNILAYQILSEDHLIFSRTPAFDTICVRV